MRAHVVALTGLLAAPGLTAEWVRVTSPGIEVLTDAGEKTGRQVMSRFQQIHQIFHQANIADSPLTVRVFVFSSEKEFHSYREGEATSGFYQSGADRDYIVMRAGPIAERVASHEYVHLVLNHSSASLPTWFEEGTAEFYSTLQAGRGRLSVGEPIESHLAVLSSERWLNATQLASVNSASPSYTERNRVGIFYAQSWALVHMLNLSPSWRDGMPQFAVLMAEGREPIDAFRSAFGKTMDDALSALSGYLRSMQAASIPVSPEETTGATVEQMSTIDASVARADLAMQVRRIDLARKLLEGAARDRPESAGLATALGGLALAENRNDEARRHLERAIALGSRQGAAYFELAMLERDSGAKREDVDQLLEKVIAITPNFAEAHFLLGVHATDDGRLETATVHLREAARILPRQSYFWHALAYAEWRLGQAEEAAESARRAVATAANADEANMAETLAAAIRNRARAAAQVKRAVQTPSSWQNRKGDTRVEGVLARVDCQGAAARLTVIGAKGEPIVLNVPHPSEIELVHAPQATYQFSCGAQQIRVNVEYVAATGEVTRIEFR